jgi:hypothetical protein
MRVRITFHYSDGTLSNIFERGVKQTNKLYPDWVCSILNIFRYAMRMDEMMEVGREIRIEFKED